MILITGLGFGWVSQLIYMTSKLRLSNTVSLQFRRMLQPSHKSLPYLRKKKSVLKKETTHLEEAGRKKAKSDS